MNTSINKVLKVIQSLEQFDYLFKCAGVKLISCWDLKEHHYHQESESENFNRIPTVLYLFGIINKVSQQWR